MKRTWIKPFLRLKILLTSSPSAAKFIRRECELSLAALSGLSEFDCTRAVRVPPMMGVDEDMRDWSLYQVLEHNTIVNGAFTRIVLGLSKGQTIAGLGDPKRDVMPSAHPGPSVVESFRSSVDRHLRLTAKLPKLRGTPRHPHPVCGPLDAHGWHVFFGVHLALHRAQMETIRRSLPSSNISKAK